MAEAPKNMFWDVIAGRAPLPAVLGLLGWNAAQAEPGHVRAGFRGQETFHNPVGHVQGGILGAMLDGVMGAAAVSLLGADESITTLEMKTNYMRSVKDVPLVGDGRVVHRGGSVIFMEGSITTEDGSLVATATATGRVIRAAGGSER
jgi:uncharacterized protein (TIGR00369 family)